MTTLSRVLWRISAITLMLIPLGLSVGCTTSKGLTFSDRMESLMPGSKGELENSDKLYLAYAKWQEHSGNYDASRQAYQIVLDDDSKNIEARLGQSRLDVKEEKFAAAEARLQETLAIAPKDARVHSSVGQYLLGQKRVAEAIPHLERALELEPVDTKHNYHLGVALAKQGDFTNALMHLQKSQGPAKAHYNLGYLLFEAKKLPEASQHFQFALKNDPSLKQAELMLAAVNKSIDPSLQLAGHQQQVSIQPAPAQQPAGQVRQVQMQHYQQQSSPQQTTTPSAPAQWPHR